MTPTLLACIALAGSLLMLFRVRPRLFPIVAVAASGIEVLTALGALHLRFSSLSLICGVALAVAGVAVYLRASAKHVVACATAVGLIGLMQALAYLH